MCCAPDFFSFFTLGLLITDETTITCASTELILLHLLWCAGALTAASLHSIFLHTMVRDSAVMYCRAGHSLRRYAQDTTNSVCVMLLSIGT